MFRAKVTVTLRVSILDPQGKAVEHAVSMLGIKGIQNVRMGKYIEFMVDEASEEQARRAAEEVCRKLLANPVMEDYQYRIDRA